MADEQDEGRERFVDGRHRSPGLQVLRTSHLQCVVQVRHPLVCGTLRQVPTPTPLCLCLCLPESRHQTKVLTYVTWSRWGSGKSFLVELLKREFDKDIKSNDTTKQLQQKFEYDRDNEPISFGADLAAGFKTIQENIQKFQVEERMELQYAGFGLLVLDGCFHLCLDLRRYMVRESRCIVCQ